MREIEPRLPGRRGWYRPKHASRSSENIDQSSFYRLLEVDSFLKCKMLLLGNASLSLMRQASVIRSKEKEEGWENPPWESPMGESPGNPFPDPHKFGG